MGRKALIAVFCWLALSEISAKVVQTAYGVGFLDNVSAESAPRLYRNVPVGVYASANPYAAYSFQAPTFVTPKNGQVIPVKEESVVVQNTNGFLKDSYGQRFVEAPQTIAYKATFPQFVQLQNLPAHLSQPLVAASSPFQYGQSTPHFFKPTQFNVPKLQALAPSTVQQYTAYPITYASNIKSFAPSSFLSQGHSNPISQQQPASNNNVYVNSLTAKHFNNLQNEPKFQRIQQEPKFSSSSNNHQQQFAPTNKLQLVQAPKETSITTVTNGKKTVVNLITKPPIPLLDLTLLEPLTFKNPLVPQVQHFLPRINQATYKKLPEINMVKKHQMEFVVQNTKSYDSSAVQPKNKASKKKQKKRPQNENRDVEELHPTPRVTISETPHDAPEISYEINSPNYKETYSEKKVSYKKETESEPINISYNKETSKEPVHYSYEKRTEMKPIHYSYVQSSKEPEQIKQAYYENNNNEQPKHLVYHFNTEQKGKEDNEERQPSSNNSESESTPNENSEEVDEEEAQPQHEPNDDQQEYYEEAPKVYYSQPEHREQSYHRSGGPAQVRQALPQSESNKPEPNEEQQHFQEIVPEYEEDITILPTHKPHASQQQNQDHHSNNKHNHHSEPQNKEPRYDYHQSHYSSLPVQREKSERIIIKEGTTSEVHKPNELMEAMVKKQEESEEDFEKAYKNSAYGFPAYNAPLIDNEKEIYNPESYGASQYQSEFNLEKSPLRQYEADGDEYPNQTRSQYKDARDKKSEEYFLDYAVSRPESLTNRYKQKENYYKTYTQHKPENYFVADNEEKKQKEKYTALPTHGYPEEPQQKQQSAKYVVASPFQEYSYAREAPYDNSAYATGPVLRYKSKTQFVEPQYQYGFEPLSLPHLLDRELAAMASNDSPKSNKPSTRKKIYKVMNWSIKKSSRDPKAKGS